MSNFETVGERIRHLRKDHLELTLKEMSEKLNVSLSNLGNVETGVIKATDRLLSDICREFGVSIHWLEDGEGGIFKERTTYEKLADFFGEVLNDEPESVRVAVLSSFAELDDDGWVMLAEECKFKAAIYNKMKKDSE